MPSPEVHFQGVALGKDAELPLAFFRGKDRPKYGGRRAASWWRRAEKWPRLSRVELTGNEIEVKSEKYLETREAGLWVKESDAVVPKRAPPRPGAKRRRERRARAGRAAPGSKPAFEGLAGRVRGHAAVYVTLISPGRGGTPSPARIRWRRRRRRSAASTSPASSRPPPWKRPASTSTPTCPGPRTSAAPTRSTAPTGTTTGATEERRLRQRLADRRQAGCSSGPSRRFPTGWHGVRWRPEASRPRCSSCTSERALSSGRDGRSGSRTPAADGEYSAPSGPGVL